MNILKTGFQAGDLAQKRKFNKNLCQRQKYIMCMHSTSYFSVSEINIPQVPSITNNWCKLNRHEKKGVIIWLKNYFQFKDPPTCIRLKETQMDLVDDIKNQFAGLERTPLQAPVVSSLK